MTQSSFRNFNSLLTEALDNDDQQSLQQLYNHLHSVYKKASGDVIERHSQNYLDRGVAYIDVSVDETLNHFVAEVEVSCHRHDFTYTVKGNTFTDVIDEAIDTLLHKLSKHIEKTSAFNRKYNHTETMFDQVLIQWSEFKFDPEQEGDRYDLGDIRVKWAAQGTTKDV